MEFFSGNELEISLLLHDLSSNAFAVERSEEICSSSIYLLLGAIVMLLSIRTCVLNTRNTLSVRRMERVNATDDDDRELYAFRSMALITRETRITKNGCNVFGVFAAVTKNVLRVLHSRVERVQDEGN